MSDAPSHAPLDRYRSAGLVLFAFGLLKLVYGFSTGFRMILSPAGEGGTGVALLDLLSTRSRELAFAVILFYAISAAFCFVTGAAVQRRIPLAINLGAAYAILQIAGVLFIKWIGFIAIVNAAFGVMVLISLWVARVIEREQIATR